VLTWIERSFEIALALSWDYLCQVSERRFRVSSGSDIGLHSIPARSGSESDK